LRNARSRKTTLAISHRCEVRQRPADSKKPVSNRVNGV
jgi:hypothetical protein